VIEMTGVPMGEQFKAGLAERRETSRLTQEEIAARFARPAEQTSAGKAMWSNPKEMQTTLRAMIEQ
jgi:hypothetical protein